MCIQLFLVSAGSRASRICSLWPQGNLCVLSSQPFWKFSYPLSLLLPSLLTELCKCSWGLQGGGERGQLGPPGWPSKHSSQCPAAVTADCTCSSLVRWRGMPKEFLLRFGNSMLHLLAVFTRSEACWTQVCLPVQSTLVLLSSPSDQRPNTSKVFAQMAPGSLHSWGLKEHRIGLSVMDRGQQWGAQGRLLPFLGGASLWLVWQVTHPGPTL